MRGLDTAIDRQLPPNIRLIFKVDDDFTNQEMKIYHRRIVRYCGSFANQRRFKSVTFCCRHNDYGTGKNNRLDVFAYVPVQYRQELEKRCRNWTGLLDVKYLSSIIAIKDEFDQVFSAISDELHAANPKLPFKRSGLIRGPRTSYSRSLWWNNR